MPTDGFASPPTDLAATAAPLSLDHDAYLTARARFLARLRVNAEIRQLETAFAASPSDRPGRP